MKSGEANVVSGSTAAVLTPSGRGAVAVISVQGDVATSAIDKFFRVASGRPVQELSVGRVCFGHWIGADAGSSAEDVVVIRRAAKTVEVSCHGGTAAVERILSDLRELGVGDVSWQDQLAGTGTDLEAELQELLSRTTTRRAALKLLELQETQPAGIRQLMTSAEAILSEPAQNVDDAKARLLAELDASFKWTSFGLHLTEPWSIVLAGRPNVGKSTLMNVLTGFDRAIVYDEPGTTRDVVSSDTALDGWPVRLLDTAGIRDATGEIERQGVLRSRQAMEKADCICLLLDASSPLTDDDEQLMREVAASGTPSILVASKSDLISAWDTNRVNALPVSATTESGIDGLIEALAIALVPEIPPVAAVFPVSNRQVTCLTAARTAAEQGDYSAVLTRLRQM